MPRSLIPCSERCNRWAYSAILNLIYRCKSLILRKAQSLASVWLVVFEPDQPTRFQSDPDMTGTKKGKTWHFGMKVHIGTDRRGVVRTVTTTTAREADIAQLPSLLHGEETAVHGDRGYYGRDANAWLKKRGIRSRLQKRAASDPPHRIGEGAQPMLVEIARLRRAPLPVIKWLWGFAKVRYRGLAKKHGPGVCPARARQPLIACGASSCLSRRNPSMDRRLGREA